ncbi:TetR/AcrR family transcriptional regulator [Rhodococcoides kroppenstedtii]|uniref:TetR/AcrR family transcriptional regulator n=1 Tax=Rhodococcoides kroppenstedtii TaxID=293050 RepID=UPI00362891AA
MTTDRTPRERMVLSAARMMRERGVTGVGMRQIAADAQGPRGSLQRYFPGGKTQVMSEALDAAVADFSAGTRAAADADDLPSAIAIAVESWRTVLVENDFGAGCPIAALVVDASESEPLRERARDRFAQWRRAVASIYRRFGYDRAPAWDEAMLLISAIEGAALVARAGRTVEPLDAVERLLVDRARRGGR